LAGTLIQGLLILNIGTYEPKNWHGSLITLALICICIIFNTILARKLPLVEGIFVFLHILGVVMIIPLWIMSPRREGGSPIVDFYNPSGWTSNGIATLVGLTGPITALIGFDCSVHMAEEAKDSSRTVPVTLLVGYTVNVALGFLVLMACIYTIGPLEAALNNPSSTGFIFIDILYSSTQSYSGVNFMAAILIINLTASSIAGLAAASRQLWAFARNKGVPFAIWFAPAQLPFDIPIHAIVFSLILPVAIVLINIGSSEALGILLSIYNSALVGSYIITISCVLLHRLQGRKLPKARYSLGKWGIFVNSVALIFIIPMFVFSFFPPVPKPTGANMNWAIVLVGGIVVLASAYYIVWGRKTFTPPHETVEDYIERYQATTASERGSNGGVVEEPVEKETVTGESAEAES
jgi:amino acid transporter